MTDDLVEYAPPVQLLCQDVNTKPIDRLPYVVVDGEYVYAEPSVSKDGKVLVAPMGVYYIVSNFTYGVDYINFNSTCIDYDIEAMPSCALTVCGGDLSCINTYGSVCAHAGQVVSDARRSGTLMRAAFDDLALEEKKAMVYRESTDGSLSDRRSPRAIGLIIAAGVGILGSLVMSGAALVIAQQTADRVNVLEKQLDLTKNMVVQLGDDMVTVTNKLNTNIELTNNRVDELQQQTNAQFRVINNNFQEIHDNMKAFKTDVNERFKVTFGYQSWYGQMMSITTQLTQAAMQMKYKAANVKLCLLNLADGIMGVCPSGLDVFTDYPGLANTPTVQALLYKDRKLLIVNKVPNDIRGVYMSKIVGVPSVSNGTPCWPDYDVWSHDGAYYLPGDCDSRFCNPLVKHVKFYECLADPSTCKVTCAECFKNICWRDGNYSWTEGTVETNIEAEPPPEFERPTISDGIFIPNITINVSDPVVIEQLNTSVVLVDIRDDINGLSEALGLYEKQYDELTSQRTSGNAGLLILSIVTLVWLLILTFLLVAVSCKKESSAGNSSVFVSNPGSIGYTKLKSMGTL